MASRKDQDVWWKGKNDAAVARKATRHYGYDRYDFYHGTGNYSTPGGPVRLATAAQFDMLQTSGRLSGSVDTDTAGASSIVLDASSVVLEALAQYDAQDRRRKYAATARAVMVCKYDVVLNRPSMTDLAGILGVKRPTAIGRFKSLLTATRSDAFKAILDGCRGNRTMPILDTPVDARPSLTAPDVSITIDADDTTLD